MGSTLLFCTSSLVTAQDVHDLNEEYRQFSAILYNPFTPARSDASAILPHSKTPVDYTVEVFSDASDARLRQLCEELVRASRNEAGGSLFSGEQFAVLDERGCHDRTIVFHASYLPPEEEDQTPSWHSWRVTWADAYEMDTQCEMTPDILYTVFLDMHDAYTNENGVFMATEALKAAGAIVE